MLAKVLPIKKNVSLTSRKLAKSIAEFASEKKAIDIVVLDMRKHVNFCDYFVVCSGNTDRQVKAVSKGIDDGLGALGLKMPKTQGDRDAKWIVIDMGDVVAHIFEKEAREFYGLEYLWQDAKQINWEKSTA